MKRFVRPTRQIRFSSIISVHRDTVENNANVAFEFTKENLVRAEKEIGKYPPQYKKALVMSLLDLGQRQLGYTSISVMNYVAKLLDMPPMRVYEVATFYTMYMRQPVGKYNVQICTTTPCQLCGSDDIVSLVKSELGIDVGETTENGMFTLQEVECAGACVNGPVVAINDDYYEDLTPESVVKILQGFASGQIPEHGTLSRKSCEPFKGQKTLLSKEPFDVSKVTRSDL